MAQIRYFATDRLFGWLEQLVERDVENPGKSDCFIDCDLSPRVGVLKHDGETVR